MATGPLPIAVYSSIRSDLRFRSRSSGVVPAVQAPSAGIICSRNTVIGLHTPWPCNSAEDSQYRCICRRATTPSCNRPITLHLLRSPPTPVRSCRTCPLLIRQSSASQDIEGLLPLWPREISSAVGPTSRFRRGASVSAAPCTYTTAIVLVGLPYNIWDNARSIWLTALSMFKNFWWCASSENMCPPHSP